MLFIMIGCSAESQNPRPSEPVAAALFDLNASVHMDRPMDLHRALPTDGRGFCIHCTPCPIFINPAFTADQIKTTVFAQYGFCVGGWRVDGTDPIVEDNQTFDKAHGFDTYGGVAVKQYVDTVKYKQEFEN